MSFRFIESGGNYHASTPGGPGIWSNAVNNSIVSNAPTGRSTSFAYTSNNQNLTTVAFPAQSGLIAGAALYIPTPTSGSCKLIGFTLLGSAQCDARLNGSGQIIFTRNGTQIGGTSTLVIAPNTWNFFEFKALLATGATGTCEIKVNGVVALTATSVQNATTTATADAVQYFPGSGNGYATDFYCVDTTTGPNNSYQGDISVTELFPNGAGVNSDWTVQQGSFTLTAAANASGGTTVYTGTITNGATPTNAYQGMYFNVTGFANGGNNGGPWLCTASTTTTITLQNAGGVSETHAGTCAFQNPVQAGIHGGIVDLGTTNLGTRPPSDATGPLQYLKSLTANQKTDYAHQALSLSGQIAAVAHMTYARKDDAGARVIKQICESNGTEEVSADVGLNTSLQYYADILENDPHTSAAWVTANFNNATFGIKLIS
jgi:hypothetical protein